MSICLRSAIVIALWNVVSAYSRSLSSPQVELKRVPDAGIQPQVAVDQNGTIHLVYFKGDPSQGDLFYARSNDGEQFSDPIRVNSVPGTAIAIGNIRAARIAVGRRGNVYVAWNSSPKLGNPALGRSPMLFSKLDESRTIFEPERNLIHTAYGIDGGAGIAADQQGWVYVFWHAPIPGKEGEEFRRVWMARSEDDGRSFEPERIAWDQPTGACSCCSLNAFADRAGRIYVLFRSAQEMVHRDMYLLESTDRGSTFKGSDISKWNLSYCAMSSEAFVGGPAEQFAAWETEKQVRFGRIDPTDATVSDSPVSLGGANQKYPSLALNRDGLLLVSWTEGMGWKRGGSVHWQIFNEGKRIGNTGSADGVPAWSLVAVYARRTGNFVVLY
ncbi:MAG: sialidase family protein [Bryobacteraceae bacterium]